MFSSRSEWIWCAEGAKNNQYVEFVTDFLSVDNASAVLTVATEGNYAAWLNGTLVSFGQFNDYTYERHYNEAEVSLKKGNNHLYILAYRKGDIHCSASACGTASIRFEIEGLVGSDPCVLSRPHPCFTRDVPLITGQLGFSFEYDARRESDEGYAPSVPVAVDATLEPRPTELTEMKEELPMLLRAQGIFRNGVGATIAEQCQNAWIRPVYKIPMFNMHPSYSGGHRYAAAPRIVLDRTVPLTLCSDLVIDGDGIYLLFDLGREESGFISLSFTAQEGTVIDITWGEHLDDLRVRSFIARHYADRYIAKEGKNDFLYPIQRIACRYMQFYIHTKDTGFSVDYMGLIPVEYPFHAKALHFSDHLHERIYETSLRTLILCAHEHYEDCPNREQSLYAFDSRNQMLLGYLAFGEKKLPAACLHLLEMEEYCPGWQMLCAPAQNGITIPVFTCAWFAAMWDYLLYTGDTAFIQKELPRLRHYANTHLRLFNGRLFEKDVLPGVWHFYEWAPGLSGDEEAECYAAPYQLYMLLELRSYENILRAIGETTEADSVASVAASLSRAIHETFWDDSADCYLSYVRKNGEKIPHAAELCQALAVVLNVADKEKEHRLIARLADKNNPWVKATLSSTMFKYQAIMKEPSYLDTVLEEIADVWGGMLYENATSFWETVVGADDFDNAGSLCHGWSAIPIYVYFTYVLGVVPDAPGHFVKKPLPCALTICEK